MFDYQQKPSTTYAKEYEKVKWDREEKDNANAQEGGKQESISFPVCKDEARRTFT